MSKSPKTTRKQRPSWVSGEVGKKSEETTPEEAMPQGSVETTPPARAEDHESTQTMNGAGESAGTNKTVRGGEHTQDDPEHAGLQQFPRAVLQPADGEYAAKALRSASSEEQSPERFTAKAGSSLSSLVRRIFGPRRSTAEDGAVASGPDPSSPEEVERRLKLALRETSVGGLAKIGVGSPKGGVGKSSIAYTVAGIIGGCTNLRVVLVDADPNFGSTRLLVPRPVEHSVMDLAADAPELERLSDLRCYLSQHELMRLDVLCNPVEAAEIAAVEDLGAAYERVDAVLSRYYDIIVYDLGLGFRDPAIRKILSLSDELLFVSDGEVIPNAMLSDALRYVENLGVDLSRTTLALNHRLPPGEESATTPLVRSEHAAALRRVTEIPYDTAMSRQLNRRSFHVEELKLSTRLGILTTAAACLEGLRTNTASAGARKVVSASGAAKKANG